MIEIKCTEADRMREGLRPLSSLTNYVADRALNPRLPARTAITWGLADGTEVMREELDENGCRHWLLDGSEAGA